MTLSLFAVTAPGLEIFARQELKTLGFSVRTGQYKGRSNEDAGGVAFEGELPELYYANLYLRTASRVLVRMESFYAAAFSELDKKATRLPWEKYLHPGQPLALRVTCHKSRLYHSGGVAERVAGAITRRLGKPAQIVKFDEESDKQPQLIIVRLVNNLCTISLDSSGALLHRRGYRLETAKAPLRETLAAGLIYAAGWDGNAPLLDPFCGSGTIPIEAALLARRMAPGSQRHFTFMDWPGFNSQAWQSLLDEAASRVIPIPVHLQGSDRDAGAVRMAQNNAARAGIAEDITFDCKVFSAIKPPPLPGWVITNPPYGLRVRSNKDLRDLYTGLGKVLRQSCPGWSVGILCADDMLAGHTHLKFERILPLVNGGTMVKYYMGHID